MMGEAKNRGTCAQRKAASIAKQEDEQLKRDRELDKGYDSSRPYGNSSQGINPFYTQLLAFGMMEADKEKGER